MITREEAIRLSKVKWQYIVDNDGLDFGLTEAHPELSALLSTCGLCHYHRDGTLDNACDAVGGMCPLAQGRPRCYHANSPFLTWAHRKTKENAQRVLDLINQIS